MALNTHTAPPEPPSLRLQRLNHITLTGASLLEFATARCLMPSVLPAVVQDVVEGQLTSGQLPPETATALQRMQLELRRADIRQKVRLGVA